MKELEPPHTRIHLSRHWLLGHISADLSYQVEVWHRTKAVRLLYTPIEAFFLPLKPNMELFPELYDKLSTKP